MREEGGVRLETVVSYRRDEEGRGHGAAPAPNVSWEAYSV